MNIKKDIIFSILILNCIFLISLTALFSTTVLSIAIGIAILSSIVIFITGHIFSRKKQFNMLPSIIICHIIFCSGLTISFCLGNFLYDFIEHTLVYFNTINNLLKSAILLFAALTVCLNYLIFNKFRNKAEFIARQNLDEFPSRIMKLESKKNNSIILENEYYAERQKIYYETDFLGGLHGASKYVSLFFIINTGIFLISAIGFVSKKYLLIKSFCISDILDIFIIQTLGCALVLSPVLILCLLIIIILNRKEVALE